MEATHGQQERLATKRNWFARHLCRPVSNRSKDHRKDLGTEKGEETVVQPPAAPMNNMCIKLIGPSTTLPGLERPLRTLPNKHPPPPPPPPPPRQGSGVVQDNKARQDTSVAKLPQPLMTGLPYWRKADTPSPSPSSKVQYARSIRRPPQAQPEASNNCQHNSFIRSGKKVQVRMPTLLRANSQSTTVKQQKIHRRSTSRPIQSAVTYNTCEVPAQDNSVQARLVVQTVVPQLATLAREKRAWTKKGYRAYPTVFSQVDTPPSADVKKKNGPLGNSNASCPMGAPGNPDLPSRTDNSTSASVHKCGAPLAADRRRANAVSHTPEGIVQSTVAAPRSLREDSMKTISDVPTYSSGPQPPSYRSRTASILTMSSFGCVDGMDAERRQASQQRAVQQRGHGVKRKLRKLTNMR